MNWVDIGINLTNKRFAHDREDVINNARAAGISKMLITGTNVTESIDALELAKNNPEVLYSTAGCHPHDAKLMDNEGLATLKQISCHPSVVAIGECGLDFNRDFSPRETQIEAFKLQLELAIETQKPLFLHERDAFDTQFAILQEYWPSLKDAVIHCFTGNQHQLEKYLELGLHIGITGWICDERRGQELFNITRIIPDERLMVETDAPYLTPRNLTPKPKGGRNEPKYLPHIGQTIAQARNQPLSHIAAISYTNSCRFFGLPHS